MCFRGNLRKMAGRNPMTSTFRLLMAKTSDNTSSPSYALLLNTRLLSANHLTLNTSGSNNSLESHFKNITQIMVIFNPVQKNGFQITLPFERSHCQSNEFDVHEIPIFPPISEIMYPYVILANCG